MSRDVVVIVGDGRLIVTSEGALRELTAPPPKPAPARLLGKMAVPCPRCRAGVGEPCDRRTLGAHAYHRARVDACAARVSP